MSYQRERDDFIARMTKEDLPLDVTRRLLAGATTLQRYAELACSSEAADRDRVPCPAAKTYQRMSHVQGVMVTYTRKVSGPCLCDDYPAGSHAEGVHADVPRITVLGNQLERRLIKGMPEGWAVDFQGDPRGYVLRVIPPSYAAENAQRPTHDPRCIGVPPGPTRLRF